MRILLTGGSGFIGQYVVPILLQSGHDVYILGRSSEKLVLCSWWNEVTYIAYDLDDAYNLDLKQVGYIDVLIHLAWQGLPNYKDLFHIEKNMLCHYHFIRSMVQQGVQQVLVAGTCMEYGLQNGCLHEGLPTKPSTPYALAKDSLRQFLQCLQAEMPFVLQWARLFYMHGRGQNPLSLLAGLDRSIDNGEHVFHMSGGEQLRDYLPVKEVAKKITALMERKYDGVFNVCRGQPISIRRLVKEHLKNRDYNMILDLGYYPYPDYEPMASWGDATKLNRALGLS